MSTTQTSTTQTSAGQSNAYDQIASRYIEVWNETDAQRRAGLVAALFTADATYIDPLAAAAGHAELSATIGAVQEQFAGFRFRLLGPVDGHHDQLRFQWELGPEGVEAPIIGFDVAHCSGDRIAQVFGFLDQVPAA